MSKEQTGTELIEEFGVSQATVVGQAFLNMDRDAAKRDAERRAFGHKHDNALGEYVKSNVFGWAIQNKYITKCECGKYLVLKQRWANGQKIKTKSE